MNRRLFYILVLSVLVTLFPTLLVASPITVDFTFTSLEYYIGEYVGPQTDHYTTPAPPVPMQDYQDVYIFANDAEAKTETTTKTLSYDSETQWIQVIMTVNKDDPAHKYLAKVTVLNKWVYEGSDPSKGGWVEMPAVRTDGTYDMFWHEYDAIVMPEPATLSLLAIGGMAAIRRRK